MAQSNARPLSVSEAAFYAKGQFEKIRLTIEGEISQLTNKSGYKSVYFDIKDESASLSCKMWRNRFDAAGVRIALGSLVQISGYFTIWPAKGDVKFEVVSISLAGEGKLRQQVAQLAESLRREGLMDPSRKIPLPFLPEKIGLVTSPRGAAVHDVLRTLRRRYPMGQILFAGVPVEGKYAAEYLLEGLRCVYKHGAEVILLVRGGGSFEDFMPFNDETLCRAIAKCPIPIVTGIGHEPDNSIADMVADFRASTPTAAAESIAPDSEKLALELDSQHRRMARILQMQLQANSLKLDKLAERRIFSDSYELLSGDMQQLDYSAERLQRAIPVGLERDSALLRELSTRLANTSPGFTRERADKLVRSADKLSSTLPKRLEQISQGLEASRSRLMLQGSGIVPQCDAQLRMQAARMNDLSPLAVLGRGYSIARTSDNAVLKSVDSVSKGSEVSVRVSDGYFECLVENIYKEAPVEVHDERAE